MVSTGPNPRLQPEPASPGPRNQSIFFLPRLMTAPAERGTRVLISLLKNSPVNDSPPRKVHPGFQEKPNPFSHSLFQAR